MRQNDDSEDVPQTGGVEDEDEVNDDSEDVQQMPAFSVCASSSAADKDRPPHPIAVQWSLSHQLANVSSKTDHPFNTRRYRQYRQDASADKDRPPHPTVSSAFKQSATHLLILTPG